MSEKDYARATKRILSELKPSELAEVKDWDDLVKLITKKTDLENQSNLFQVVTTYWDKKFSKDKNYAGQSIKNLIDEVKSDFQSAQEFQQRKEEEARIEKEKTEAIKDVKEDAEAALPRETALRVWKEERDAFWRDKGLGLDYEQMRYAGIDRKRNPEKYLKEFYGLTDNEARRKWSEYREESEIRGV